jgi:hypothetical protein
VEDTQANPRKPALTVALWVVVVAVLLAVFSLYSRPEFMVGVANQVWSCF